MTEKEIINCLKKLGGTATAKETLRVKKCLDEMLERGFCIPSQYYYEKIIVETASELHDLGDVLGFRGAFGYPKKQLRKMLEMKCTDHYEVDEIGVPLIDNTDLYGPKVMYG